MTALMGLIAAVLWKLIDARWLRVLRFVRDRAERRTGEASLAFCVGLCVAFAAGGSPRGAAFGIVCAVVLLASFGALQWSYDRPHRGRSQKTRSLPLDRDEWPDWVPRWWPHSPGTEDIAARPWHALGWYGPFFLICTGILVWRIVVVTSGDGFFGSGVSAAITVVALPTLVFNGIYGARAIIAIARRRRR